jgi:hypothetical protein
MTKQRDSGLGGVALLIPDNHWNFRNSGLLYGANETIYSKRLSANQRIASLSTF